VIVDLFRGPGGWSEGLKQLGMTDWGVEICGWAHATAQMAGHVGARADVVHYDPACHEDVDGVIASPVCTTFSRAGKQAGLADQAYVHRAIADLAAGRDTRTILRSQCKDPKSLLTAEPARFLRAWRPDWVAMEQVPDVLPIWQQYAQILRGWGYSAWTGILNAADYGVPQTRRRAILIANRHQAVGPPEPTHAEHAQDEGLFGPDRQRWVSMADALGWTGGLTVNTRGERTTPGGNEFSADGPSWALTEKARSWALRNDTQANACERSLDEPAGTLFFGARCNDVSWVLRNGNQPNAAVRSADEPAPTMAFGHNAARIEWVEARPATTVCATDRIAPPGHRDRAGGERQFGPETVRITVEEAAVLQSFRRDYPWQGSKTKQFQQVGNAVPPLLAAHVLAAATGLPQPAALPALTTARSTP
jgi:DNA (cytosine-5)-methyltransferase 1